ncbi:beta-ketoacyl-ACP synthase III [Acuticoccus yangtzensis]|uniref:beta-ketoacyl-ACP synthase III n=1 Tax=Acuticoccus yangtzensis TaxID=1443441 RepID=UPI0009499BB3|nr:beta-ketoacyl-ACP synthase III [Acuticoccus yangtzensis]ORE96568.1 3-oxoacyl-(acyl carrier protein) synthase III [Stappia sp. 22II-S9-Z10]
MQNDTLRPPATRIAGVGSALPARVLTNADLAAMVDTSDEWIVSRTGIEERRIAADGECTSDLAERAARAALGDAGLTPDDIDLIVLATATPDNTFPSTAVSVQHRLGITRGAAFDVAAVCSGFVFAMTTADALIAQGLAKRALVIGAETFSRILDWEDRTTCVLFGDGAGAVVLEAAEGAGTDKPRGLIAACLRSDGAHKDKLYVDGGPSSTQTVGHLRMRGQEVFRFAVSATVDVVEDVFAKAEMSADDIDWFVPHQANKRIIDSSAKKLGIAPEKVILTVQKHGNTSAASIPLALAAAAEDGRIKRGDVVLLEAMGGGFTWGAVLVRW